MDGAGDHSHLRRHQYSHCIDFREKSLVHSPFGARMGIFRRHNASKSLLLRDIPRLSLWLTDRGGSESVLANFHHPLRELGPRLVFDLHRNRRRAWLKLAA